MSIVKFNSAPETVYNRSSRYPFDAFFDDFFTKRQDDKVSPKVDLAQSEEDYQLYFSLPGLSKEDVTIEVKENVLTVSGERKKPEVEGVKYYQLESAFGVFERSFKLPKDVLVQSIDATFENGILFIRIPKDESKPLTRSIEIK